jgi:hypothetical protein
MQCTHHWRSLACNAFEQQAAHIPLMHANRLHNHVTHASAVLHLRQVHVVSPPDFTDEEVQSC